MKVYDLFSKDITRSINGVIKVDQQDDRSVWQELEEFVITKELSRHFDRFFNIYSEFIKIKGYDRRIYWYSEAIVC